MTNLEEDNALNKKKQSFRKPCIGYLCQLTKGKHISNNFKVVPQLKPNKKYNYLN